MTIKVALIGLDTSHSIEFTRRMQAPDCPADQKVSGLQAVSCLRFSTPFHNDAGLDERQKQLEDWGVRVTTKFEEAVADCDAIMIEINDPAYHLEYFTRCAELGRPIFLDKPLADTIANGQKIVDWAKRKDVKVFSASSLRFVPQLIKACGEVPSPVYASIFGPLGDAPAGSGIVWYGVHTFEMLQRAMGRGAKSLFAHKNADGVTAIVKYPGNRGAVVELRNDGWVYGGNLRMVESGTAFLVDMGRMYSDLLVEIETFFRTGRTRLEIEDTLEIMAMLDATRLSVESGKEEAVQC